MALSYSNIQVELREISLRDRPDELYKASSKGTVPVLITANNTAIEESLEIMLWALRNNDKQTWLSEESDKEMNLINENDTIFKKWLDKYKYHDRYPENSKEYYRKKCDDILYRYEKQLNKTKYLSQNDISIADIAIFPFVRQFANVDYKWFENNYNQLTIWLKNICASDLFISIMMKYEIWNNTNKPMVIDFNI